MLAPLAPAPLSPAAAASVSRFLAENRLSDAARSAPSSTTRASAQSASQRSECSSEHAPDSPRDTLALPYQRQLRYAPNAGFRGDHTAETSSLGGALVPNTFKHKLHPNARTKNHIGMPPVGELSHSDTDAPAADFAASAIADNGVQTSTFRAQGPDGGPVSFSPGTLVRPLTPLWMPLALDAPWEEPAAALDVSLAFSALETDTNKANNDNVEHVRSGGLSAQPLLGFLAAGSLAGSDTCVHRPAAAENSQETPMWRKVANQYQARLAQGADLPLRHLFLLPEPTAQLPGCHTLGNSGKARADADLDDVHLTREQAHVLGNVLERVHDKLEQSDLQKEQKQSGKRCLPSGTNSPGLRGSPLKLFRNNYDTYTKAVLSEFVDKVRSRGTSVQRAPESVPMPPALPAPRLNIKTFTRAGDYTDQDFLQNADHVFAHIQRKGRHSEGAFPQAHLPSSHQIHTVTSTPKPREKNQSMDSLGMYSFSTSSHSAQPLLGDASMRGLAEYTEIERTSLASRPRLLSSIGTGRVDYGDQTDHASYTFDELSDLETRFSELPVHSSVDLSAGPSATPSADSSDPFADHESTIRSPNIPDIDSPSPHVHDVGTADSIPLREGSMASVRQFMRPPKLERAPETPGPENLIKWKRASQLRLLSASHKANLPANSDATFGHSKERSGYSKILPSQKTTGTLARGTVKPGEFPGQYGNMFFDAKRKQWISQDKENDAYSSLDAIEDLSSNSLESLDSMPASTKNPRDRRQLEVSFQVSSRGATQSLDISGHENSSQRNPVHDITSVSDCGNATFSQSNKELVSLITGSTDQIVWDSITSIDLSDKKIDRVENLEQYLPAVKSIDLSKNKLRFVEGLPQALFELDVTDNDLSDMVSFHKFRDLQVINAAFNSFGSFACLRNNVNLTRVNLMGNRIESLRGFPPIHALISLNLSRNNISGDVSLDKLSLPNLKELALSENHISSISGIEALKNLRILNVNENRLRVLKCSGIHRRLKKLLCKFNDLQELKLECFPFLRILRLDGNSLTSVTGLNKLHHLDELSVKSQYSSDIVEKFFRAATDVPHVDFSGNSSLLQLLPNIPIDAFYNVNRLNLSAVGLSTLPVDFSEKYFNVRELNLSFNKLTSLRALQNLKKLKRLQVLSNNITKVEDVLTGLQMSRKTLKHLDMRLNIINFEFYPYVFSPYELQLAKNDRVKPFPESPIPIEVLDDIESFTIHYKALSKNKNEWQARNNDFFKKLKQEGNHRMLKERLDYETILIGYFLNLRELDGSGVPHERRASLGKPLTE